jgi:hypothetical protein
MVQTPSSTRRRLAGEEATSSKPDGTPAVNLNKTRLSDFCYFEPELPTRVQFVWQDVYRALLLPFTSLAVGQLSCLGTPGGTVPLRFTLCSGAPRPCLNDSTPPIA